MPIAPAALVICIRLFNTVAGVPHMASSMATGFESHTVPTAQSTSRNAEDQLPPDPPGGPRRSNPNRFKTDTS